MVSRKLSRFGGYLYQEFHRESAYLWPLRIFIGIGWIRAGLEKFIEPGWYDGTALLQFFETQTSSGQVVFPFYKSLIENVFAPNAQGLSWIIMIGQILVGVAIFAGIFTNLAIFWGLFMNLNFIFAGRVNPSAFYVVIQVALLMGNIGVILGIDRYLSRKIPFNFLVAQPDFTHKYLWAEKTAYLVMAITSVIVAVLVAPFIQDFGPTSVDDPAMILLVLSLIMAMSAFIIYLRFEKREYFLPPGPPNTTRDISRKPAK